jgi:Uma2 family endonuclease
MSLSPHPRSLIHCPVMAAPETGTYDPMFALERGELPDRAMISTGQIRPLSVEQYMQLVESSAFEDDEAERLAGVEGTMTAQDEAYIDLVIPLNQLFARRLTGDFMVAPQCTYWLARYAVPEPDFAIITTTSMWKQPWRAVWMIEIACAAQHKDRGLKARLYAAAGVPEYWVIDARTMTVVIHRGPSPRGYRSIVRHDELAPISPQAIPTLVFRLRDLLADQLRR